MRRGRGDRIANMELLLTTQSAEETEALARHIGLRLQGGETIELVSDLGGGKTTFTKGLAQGIGSHDRVSSPTFTISKVYKGDKLELQHFDFYRLAGDAGLIGYELQEVMDDTSVVTVVEWGDVVGHVLPEARIVINITKVGETERELRVRTPDSLQYVVDGLAG